MSKSLPPASADPPRRSHGTALRPWALLGLASVCSVAAVPADGALRNTFIGLAGGQAAIAFGVLADRTIHPRWPWSGPRILGKRSYENFPYRTYFRWVARARHRVVIIDTVCHLLSDADRAAGFFKSLREALKNGATIDLAPYCPCCQLLTERGKQLGLSNRDIRDLAEQQLTELDQFQLTLTDAERERFHVWPHRRLLTYVEYRCDDRVLRSYLDGKDSQSCQHKLYSASSDEGRTCERRPWSKSRRSSAPPPSSNSICEAC